MCNFWMKWWILLVVLAAGPIHAQVTGPVSQSPRGGFDGSQINHIVICDTHYATIQACISAAGTNSSVIIPSGQHVGETFTNSNNVTVEDHRGGLSISGPGFFGFGNVQNYVPNSTNFQASTWGLVNGSAVLTTGQADPWGGYNATMVVVSSSYALAAYNTANPVSLNTPYEVCVIAHAVSGNATARFGPGFAAATMTFGSNYSQQCATVTVTTAGQQTEVNQLYFPSPATLVIACVSTFLPGQSIGCLPTTAPVITSMPGSIPGWSQSISPNAPHGTNQYNFFNTTNNTMLGTTDSYVQAGLVPGTAPYGYGSDHQTQYDSLETITSPGCDNYVGGNCQMTGRSMVVQNMYVAGAGDALMHTWQIVHYGNGDTKGVYSYLRDTGGVTAATAEGGGNASFDTTDGETEYQGTIQSGHSGAGQTALYVNCTSGCGVSPYGVGATNLLNGGQPASVGQGLYVTDEQTPYVAGQIESTVVPNGEIPGTITVNVTSGLSKLTTATAWGTLAAAEYPTANPAGTYQSMTFTVSLGSGSPAFVSGQLVCFAGSMHDQTTVTAVSPASGGTQSITVNVQQPHESGSWIIEGSGCGLYADVLANHSAGYNYPFDIIGVQSISGNNVTFWYRWFAAAAQNAPQNPLAYGNMILQSVAGTTATSMTSDGSKNVTISGGTAGNSINGPTFNNATQIYINSNNANLNGVCTNAVWNSSASTITCTSTNASAANQTASSATIAYGDTQYGNTEVNFYQGAAVNDPQDETANPVVVDGTVISNVEPNNMPLASGDLVVVSHQYAHRLLTESDYYDDNNPITWSGFSEVAHKLNGLGVVGNPLAGFGQAISYVNENNFNSYSYWGGAQLPPDFVYVGGPWKNFAALRNAPQSGGSLFSVGCASSGSTWPGACNNSDTNYSYYIFKSDQGDYFGRYYPATRIFTIGAAGCTYSFTPTGYNVSGSGCGASTPVPTSLVNIRNGPNWYKVGTWTPGTPSWGPTLLVTFSLQGAHDRLLVSTAPQTTLTMGPISLTTSGSPGAIAQAKAVLDSAGTGWDIYVLGGYYTTGDMTVSAGTGDTWTNSNNPSGWAPVADPGSGANIYPATVVAAQGPSGGVTAGPLSSTGVYGNLNVKQIPTPSNGIYAYDSTLSGTLAAGTYYYNYAFCTTQSTSSCTPAAGETSITVSGSTNTVYIRLNTAQSVDAVPYILFGRGTTSGGEQPLGYVSGASAMFEDNGSLTPSGTMPSTNNTQGTYQINGNNPGAPGGLALYSNLPVKYTPSLTPAAATVSACTEQTFTVTGITASQVLGYPNPPSSLGAHIWIGSARVTAANTIAISFCADATGGTPPAGAWGIVAY